MSLPKACLINVTEYLDLREKDKQLTYSGYKRSKVLQSFDKDLQKKNTIGAVYWMTELILSGCVKILLDKCLNFFMKNINISNPNLPSLLYDEIRIIGGLIDEYKGDPFAVADNGIFRNHICELVSILALSDKQKYENRIKCKDDEFNIKLLKDKMEADDTYIKQYWKNGDDRIAFIPFNEFKYHIHKTYNRERAVFWISWILELHKRNAKKKVQLEFAERDHGVGKRHKKYFVWLLWDIILDEVNARGDSDLTREIHALHKLYIINFGKRHITSRLSYILCAVLYITQTIPAIRFTKPVCSNYEVLTLMNIQINILFKSLCNKYQAVKEKKIKKDFYKKEFQTMICEREENINIFSNKKRFISNNNGDNGGYSRREIVKPKPNIIKPKVTKEPMNMKYLSQVNKIANFQYRRGLNI